MNKVALTIGLLADPHVAGGAYANRYCDQSLAKLADCIGAFVERRVDMIVNLGDAIDGVEGGSMGPREHLESVRQAVARFDGPKHLVLGNHDVDCLTKAEMIVLAGCEAAQAYYSFDAAGLHFVVLDTNNYADGADFTPTDHPEYWGDAWLGGPQLDWLADDLAGAGGRGTVVFAHAGLDHHEVDGRRDPHCIIDGPAVRELLARAGNVRAVFQGHYHTGRSCVQGGISYVTLAAMCEGPYPQTAYAVATIHTDGAITVEGAGQQESIELPQQK